eukprot:scaffold71432_cov58-Phaeocystis_antarctica.AAC.1
MYLLLFVYSSLFYFVSSSFLLLFCRRRCCFFFSILLPTAHSALVRVSELRRMPGDVHSTAAASVACSLLSGCARMRWMAWKCDAARTSGSRTRGP